MGTLMGEVASDQAIALGSARAGVRKYRFLFFESEIE
jgi:hypothetical protein